MPERSWDVSADGKRFLLVKPGPLTDKPVTMMHVVLNWAEELKRLAPASSPMRTFRTFLAAAVFILSAGSG